MAENLTQSSVPETEGETKPSFMQKVKNAPKHPRVRKVAAYTAGAAAAVGGVFALAHFLNKEDDDVLVLEPGTDYTVTDSTTETTQVTEA